MRMMRPRVSVIVPAFNLAQYLPAAIDSALAQDPPGGSIEVIVVDDGSTDETARVLDTYGDRIRVIRQPNRGLVAAVDRGLEVAAGEYIGLLDADDEWPRDRLRRHVAILDSFPSIGLVHGDMEMIDAHGQTTHPSFFALNGIHPTDGRVLGRLLANNFVSGGASTFRASLLPAIHPIADEAAYPNWSIAACVATVAEIAFDPGIANRYRYHGANIGLGAGPEQLKLMYGRELPWRR
jgi:glycosyltransferase involved in cell wall biosynthesis